MLVTMRMIFLALKDEYGFSEDEVVNNFSLDDKVLRHIDTVDVMTMHVHKQTTDAIKRESKKAYEWVVNELIQHWTRFIFDLEVKCLDNTTNFIENFIGKIKKYGYKPIFAMLEAAKTKKDFTKSSTLKCSYYKQFGYNKRSHMEQGILQNLKGKIT
ncbi:hypothetical protein Cgig2_001005 [Carnegiea gigantea]|uniref:Uncharacterized protein n=1 Tax=Carnegiea gigantea TaxID=171969 RepID=A0A9Q1JHV6_9CARY|nr:hypothetical protein Cgig2_001005 [Carnegiea gigantea]